LSNSAKPSETFWAHQYRIDIRSCHCKVYLLLNSTSSLFRLLVPRIVEIKYMRHFKYVKYYLKYTSCLKMIWDWHVQSSITGKNSWSKSQIFKCLTKQSTITNLYILDISSITLYPISSYQFLTLSTFN